MRTIATVLLFLIGQQLYAQKACVTGNYNEAKMAGDKAYAARLEAVESFIQKQAFKIKSSINGVNAGPAASNLIRIPVVIHVLYNTAAQNISDEQIKSQLEVLNRDFRKKNFDTVSIPDRFKAMAADTEIEFVLATADPKGRATTGVVRKKTAITEFTMDDKIKFSAKGGDDAWDSKSYLNIWVGNLKKVLGYSSLPGDEAALDGVVINLSAFGTINTAAPYNMGRTAVHEVGHWLGLKHIWGDAACGDDAVDDTPKQGSFTSGCPSGFRTSCSNGSLGDMYMNYMDFTNDACMNLFTWGQKDRMRTLFSYGGPRHSLLNSKGLNNAWIEEAPLVEAAPVPPVVITPTAISVFPNPAVGEVTINFGYDISWIGAELQIINLNGVVLQRVKVTATSQKIDLHLLQSGVYIIRGINKDQKINHKLVKL